MTRIIIFDFDGTIADTFKSSIEIINSLASKYGFRNFEDDEIESLRSKSMKQILYERQISLFQLPFILRDFTTQAKKTIQFQHPFDKISQLLNELNDLGYDLSIISSNSIENIRLFLEKNNLNFFKYIYSDTSLLGKNMIISRFLKKNHIKQEDVIYVGDEVRDIEAAHKAKIMIISVTWGFNSQDAFKQQTPDYLVNKPKQLLDILKKLKY